MRLGQRHHGKPERRASARVVRNLELPPGPECARLAPDIWVLGSKEPELCLSESGEPEHQLRLLSQHQGRQEKIKTSKLTVFPTKAG